MRPMSRPQHSCGYSRSAWRRISAKLRALSLIITLLFPEMLAQITRAVVAEHRDDNRSRRERARKPQSSRYVRARTDADKQSFFARQRSRHRVSIFGGDFDLCVGEC